MKKKVSPQVKEIISHSNKEAFRLGHHYIGTEHLLLGILLMPDELAVKVLMSLGVDLKKLKEEIDKGANRGQITKTDIQLGQLSLNRHAEKALKTMTLEARLNKHDEVCPEHLLLSILRHPESTAAKILNKLEVDYEHYRTEMQYVRDQVVGETPEQKDEPENDEEGRAGGFGGGSRQQRKDKSRTPILDKFSRDLTWLAKEGKIQPVIGREKEINRIVQILSRKKKNSPVLIGESGVGKTTIVEGLALRITQHKTSRSLFDKRIVALDILALVSARHQAKLGDQIVTIIKELEKSKNLILFIDEVDLVSPSTNLESAIYNTLKLILKKGRLQSICTLKLKKYHQYIEQDGALYSSLEEVMIHPSSDEETMDILKNIKHLYEDFHKVSYSEAAIETCVKLSRDIPNRVLPDSAIDVLDEAGAAVYLNNLDVPDEILELEDKIEKLKALKNQAVHEQVYEKAADLRDEESKLVRQLEFAKVQWEEETKTNRYPVNEEDIKEVFAMIINTTNK